MRVLFATSSAAGYMRPPQLGDEQINCGPDWSDQRGPDGRWLSLKTPAGEYNLAAIAAKLPPAQKPDLVVCLVDASWRNMPRGLSTFKCPRVLLVADTHHLRRPLLGMLGYATSEPFTRVVFLYDRHHAGIFRSAGLKNLHWFPGLTFPHTDAAVRAARTARARRIAFVGQVGNIHPRRSRLIDACAARGVPIDRRALPQDAALSFYGSSLVGFNASLNGDLNLRVFEILAAGAALLTDRLAPSAGLESLFAEGRDFLAYGSPDELAERAASALSSTNATAQIGEAGARWFDEHFNEERRRAAFRALAFDGISPACFPQLTVEPEQMIFAGSTDRLVRAVVVYENLQELHRTEETVRVAVGPGVAPDVINLCRTLPRLECVADSAGVNADLVVTSVADPVAPSAAGRAAWCWDATPADLAAVDARLAGDYVRTEKTNAVYARRPKPKVSDGRLHVLLYTDDPESGGVAQYNHTILLGLVRAGYRVSCVQSRCDNPLIAEQQRLGVAHHWIDYHTGKEFGRTLEDASVARRVFSEDAPDLILFSDCCPVSNLAAREAARQLGLPYVVVLGFVGAYLAKNFAQCLPLLAKQLAAARSVVAVSQENLELMHRLFGLGRERGEVIHYGRPEKFFLPRNAEVRAKLRAQIGVPDNGVLCFTAARLAAIKGYQYQLEAITRLLREDAGRDLFFAWAGDGEERAAITREIERRGLGERVKLLGHRWDVPDWNDAADIFILPSQMEGMPLAIMEAMAKGVPVIATAVSGIPEELGNVGQLLPNPAAGEAAVVRGLVDALRKWADDPALREEQGRLGRERAERMFREEQMVAKTLGLVARALEATARAKASTSAAA